MLQLWEPQLLVGCHALRAQVDYAEPEDPGITFMDLLPQHKPRFGENDKLVDHSAILWPVSAVEGEQAKHAGARAQQDLVMRGCSAQPFLRLAAFWVGAPRPPILVDDPYATSADDPYATSASAA